jgi:hypothetical protein
MAARKISMADAFSIDARRWRFLDRPERYVMGGDGTLRVEPLKRQFKTAREILLRLSDGRGVLLADDVGLGKTTVASLVAWIVASQGKRVRIYAPNEVLRRRWAEELERHVPMLAHLDVRNDHIKQGDVEKLNAGRIQVATHHTLVKGYRNDQQRTACDLMIIDEAHRAKGDGSAFSYALQDLGARASRKLILTATPFSIRLAELERLLRLVGATDVSAVQHFARQLAQLHELGEGHDPDEAADRLVSAAKAAILELSPFLIRHGIEDLSSRERKEFGVIEEGPWDIPTAAATGDELTLLLRIDRLIQLASERKGRRRNDPRFHVGWQQLGRELQHARGTTTDPIARRHLEAATISVASMSHHAKITSVIAAIQPIVDAGEKVLVFCHHRATANELLCAMESSLKPLLREPPGPAESLWRAAWAKVLDSDDPLTAPIIDWLSSAGLRVQVGGWMGKPGSSRDDLVRQIRRVQVRHTKTNVPTIQDAAIALQRSLLDQQSTSTRALLKSIARGGAAFVGASVSHFPGRLDEGLRMMGAWQQDRDARRPETLYTGNPDIVIAMFNSPFGPDVLVTTDWLSEGVDLHRYCRHLIHYELDPSPVRTLQRNGRIRRVGSWSALVDQPIRYAYPAFRGTRDEKAVEVMKLRVGAFGLLLGGVPQIDDELGNGGQRFADAVLAKARAKLKRLNSALAVQ